MGSTLAETGSPRRYHKFLPDFFLKHTDKPKDNSPQALLRKEKIIVRLRHPITGKDHSAIDDAGLNGSLQRGSAQIVFGMKERKWERIAESRRSRWNLRNPERALANAQIYREAKAAVW